MLGWPPWCPVLTHSLRGRRGGPLRIPHFPSPSFFVPKLQDEVPGGAGEGASLSPGPCQPRLLPGREVTLLLPLGLVVGRCVSATLGKLPPRCRLRGPIRAPRQRGAWCQTLLVVLTEPPGSRSEKERHTHKQRGTTRGHRMGLNAKTKSAACRWGFREGAPPPRAEQLGGLPGGRRRLYRCVSLGGPLRSAQGRARRLGRYPGSTAGLLPWPRSRSPSTVTYCGAPLGQHGVRTGAQPHLLLARR